MAKSTSKRNEANGHNMKLRQLEIMMSKRPTNASLIQCIGA
jgi:hypothetical protein